MQIHPLLRRSLIYVLPLAVLLVAVVARIGASDMLDRLSLACFDLYEKALLREPGAAVIAFDIDFAEPDRTSPKMLLPLITQNGVGAEEAGRFLAALPDPDQRLAQAMRTAPVVTGFIMADQGETRPPALKAGFAFAGNDPLRHVGGFPKAIPNLPVLEDAAAGNGFLNQYVDWDNVV